eukprot:3934023-Rhodomonas_salina.4
MQSAYLPCGVLFGKREVVEPVCDGLKVQRGEERVELKSVSYQCGRGLDVVYVYRLQLPLLSRVVCTRGASVREAVGEAQPRVVEGGGPALPEGCRGCVEHNRL